MDTCFVAPRCSVNCAITDGHLLRRAALLWGAGTFSACAGKGAIPDSALGLTEVVWIGPESRHVYLGSPSIIKLAMPGGHARWLASHDFFGVTTLNATVQVLGTDATTMDPPCCPAQFNLLATVQPMCVHRLFPLRAVHAGVTPCCCSNTRQLNV
jgi:hypothetical protein